jgi:hypothetical protein
MPIQLSLIDFVKNRQADETDTDAPLIPESSESQDSAGVGFESDVSRAVHSALIMRPIYELEARRFRQAEVDESANAWEGVDLMWIAFAVLDVISELTEYQVGASRAEVVQKILPLVRQQVLACRMTVADEALDDLVNKVFDHLVNRANRYLPFATTYFDGAAGRYRSRRFWLVKTVYTGEGREALFTLTDEGYVAYFGLHETSALDATAIGNLRIKLLIERGNLDDAIAVAEGNRKQCARKALEVRTIRRLIRRNIQAVAFSRVRDLAEEGVKQAMGIQKEGSRLHNMVIENLLTAQSERHGAKLHRLAEKLETLSHQLMKLSGELQDLPEDYEKYSHKLFRRRASGAFPSMDEVMGRIFRLTEEDAARVGDEFMARIDPPARRALFDPAAVIEACDRALERQNVPGDHSQVVLEIDGEPIQRFEPELSDLLMQKAFERIHTLVRQEKEIRLSTLLETAAASPYGDLFPVATAMAVFQCVVDRRLSHKHSMRIALPDPDGRIGIELGAGRRYRGHELILKFRTPTGRRN